jgi:hypothetical protein
MPKRRVSCPSRRSVSGFSASSQGRLLYARFVILTSLLCEEGRQFWRPSLFNTRPGLRAPLAAGRSTLQDGHTRFHTVQPYTRLPVHLSNSFSSMHGEWTSWTSGMTFQEPYPLRLRKTSPTAHSHIVAFMSSPSSPTSTFSTPYRFANASSRPISSDGST